MTSPRFAFRSSRLVAKTTKTLLIITSLLGLAPAWADLPPDLVKDLRQESGTSFIEGEAPVAVGKRFFFSAFTQQQGQELWTSDGTPAGTRLVKDIYPGVSSGGPTHLTVVGNRVFFAAEDGEHGQELWVSDGTEAGTAMVADLHPNFGRHSIPHLITPFKNGVMFAADTGDATASIWFSDGTAAGTRRVTTLSAPLNDLHWPVAGGYLFFTDYSDPQNSSSLWRTDGTPAGTQELVPFSNSQAIGMHTTLGKSMIFSRFTESTGLELWKSDGTVKGTLLLQTVDADNNAYVSLHLILGGSLYFTITGSEGTDLWVSNGTTAGTKLLMTQSELPEMENLLPYGKHLLVPSSSGAIHVINVATRSTAVLVDPGSEGWISDVVADEKRAFFYMQDGSGLALYTASGNTRPVKLLVTDHLNSFSLALVNGRLFFTNRGEETGGTWAELWTSNGTAAGTVLLKTHPKVASSRPVLGATVGSQAFFTAEEPVGQMSLWATEGTPETTQRVSEIGPLRTDLLARSKPVALNGKVYFIYTSTSPELWVSDGTEAGTAKVTDLNADSQQLTAAGSYLYYTVHTGSQPALALTDGTAGGTRRFTEIFPAGTAPNIQNARLLTPMDGKLYFVADLPGASRALFVTDGTAAGTARIGSLTSVFGMQVAPPAPGESGPSRLYIQASVSLYSYRPDSQVELIQQTTSSSDIMHLSTGLGFAVFGARSPDDTSDRVPWISYGTAATTVPLAQHPYRSFVSAVGTRVIYDREDPQFPQYQLVSVAPNGGGSDLQVLRSGSKYPYFVKQSAPDSGTLLLSYHGETRNVILTNGQADGTHEITGLSMPNFVSYGGNPGLSSLQLGERLLMAAYTPQTGHELFSTPARASLSLTFLGDAAVGQPARPLAAGEVLDFGPAAEPRTLTLRLKNTGHQTLTQVAASPAPTAPFELVTPLPPTLPAGASMDVEITFSPTGAGTHTGSLVITSGGQLPALSLGLAGSGVDATSPPGFRGGPVDQLVIAGQPAQFRQHIVTAADPGSVSYQWLREGEPVSGAETPQLDIPATQPAHAGLYRLQATGALQTVQGLPALLAVVEPLPEQVLTPAGGTLVLTSTLHMPTGVSGTNVAYQWLQNGVPMTDFNGVSGSRTSTLRISPFTEEKTGLLTCVIALTTPTVQQRVTLLPVQAQILPPASLEVLPAPVHFVNDPVDLTLVFSDTHTKVQATGMPPGIKFDAKTARFTGKPTKANPLSPETGYEAPYPVTVTVTSLGGSSTQTFLWHVHNKMPGGNHYGLFDRSGELDGGLALGSHLQITATSTGSVTGSLQHGGKTYRFSKVTYQNVSLEEQPAGSFSVSFARPSDQPPLILTVNVAGNNRTATLSAEGQGMLESSLYPTAHASHHPAGGRSLSIIVSGGPGEQDPENRIPQGFTTLTGTMNKTGTLNWKGRLADGTSLSGSTPLIGLFPDTVTWLFYKPLYANTGSIHGSVLPSAIDREAPEPEPMFVDGYLTWNKAALPANKMKSSRNYASGIPEHGISISGSEYRPPARGELPLPWGFIEPNVRVKLHGSQPEDPDSPLENDLTVRAGGKVILDGKGTEGWFVKSLSINSTAGTFRGSVELLTPNPDAPTRPWKRTASFEGVLNQQNGTGCGNLLLPDLPTAEPPTTLSNSPLRSCPIELVPVE